MNDQKSLIKKIKLLKAHKYKLDKELEETLENLQNICDHSEYEEKDMYIPGGYLDKEEFHTWKICKICDTRFDNNVKLGGFG